MSAFRIKEAAGLLGVSDDTQRRWVDGAINVSVEIPRPSGKIIRATSPPGGKAARRPWVSWCTRQVIEATTR
jgi:hypothetical protein